MAASERSLQAAQCPILADWSLSRTLLLRQARHDPQRAFVTDCYRVAIQIFVTRVIVINRAKTAESVCGMIRKTSLPFSLALAPGKFLPHFVLDRRFLHGVILLLAHRIQST